jgi:precorrin-4 methylase/DMSO/TMAO reductase YedYZ molybdopterin-dependent catalytic subunit
MLIAVFLFAVDAGAASLSITGTVRQPINLTIEDLQRYQSVRVQLNEVMSDGKYRGVFYYQGVPLKDLLETACIEKEETAFSKKVDLAVVVRNRQGTQVILSWGEIFYKNPGEIIVATSAAPIMPRHDCTACHDSDEYKSRLDQLFRKIEFPKLVVTGDAYADRSLEGITDIEVLDLRPKMPAKKMKTLFSPGFTITGNIKKSSTFSALPQYPRKSLTVKHIGGGKGYHGINKFEGVSFKAILEAAGLKPDLNQIFLISAPDGYRSLFSYGEIFLNPSGERVIIADRMDNKPIEKMGKFCLVPPDDLMLERDVKAIEKIEVISLKKSAKLYIIGMGCADTNLISIKAISYMAKANVFVCPKDISSRFSKYMGGKPILLDLYEFAPPVLKRKHPELTQDKLKTLLKEKRANAAGIIQKTLNEGKNVAILDYGDPTIWSGSEYLRKYFNKGLIEIVPGLSSFNAANALLKEHIGCNGSIILTTSRGIMENPLLYEAAAKKGETLCIFMGLKNLPELVKFFKTCYPEQTPAYLVYKAGYSGSEHLIRTNLDGLCQTAAGYPEKFLGLIYIGPCLDGKQPFDHL